MPFTFELKIDIIMIGRIFLIDDDPVTNFVNEQVILELKLAHQVEIFTETEEALTLMENEQGKGPELVLLDLNMPYFDGFDFIETIQHLHAGQASTTRIIVLTSSSHNRDVQRLKSLGVEDVLNTPLTREKN